MDAGDADEKSDININDDNDDDDDDDDLQLCAKKGVGQRNHRHQAHSFRHQCPRSFQAPNTIPHLICVPKV